MKKIFQFYQAPQNWSLRYKLTVAYSLLTFSITGTLATSLYIQLSRVQNYAIKERLREMIALAVPEIETDFHSLIVSPTDVDTSYYHILQKRLQAIAKSSKSIKRIYTLRQQPNGQIVFVLDYQNLPANQNKIGQPLPKITPLLSKGLAAIDKAKVEEQFIHQTRGKYILYGYAPIVDDLGRQDGVLVIELDASSVIARQWTAARIALATFVLILPLALLFSIIITRNLTAPITALVESSKRIAAGELETTVIVKSQDEIGILANTFNLMVSQLKDLFHNLEAKVAKRTEELDQAYQEISLLNDRLKDENLRLSAELDITRTIQKLILPRREELAQITDLDIAGFMESATEVGGDYYDVLRHADGVKIGIGDVTGHGLESGVLMIMVQTAIRTLLIQKETDSKRFFEVLNQTIYDNVKRMDSDKNLTLALVDYQGGVMRLSGQHEVMIVVRSNGDLECIDTIDLGFPIGLDVPITDFIAETCIKLEKDDVVVLYTDGVTEAEDMNGVQYGLERLCHVIQANHHQSAKEIQQAVIKDVHQHIGKQQVYDDITLLVLKQR